MEEKKEKLEMPAKTLEVKILGAGYKINMPTNGQRIDIESGKIRMTGGAHKDLVYGGDSAITAWMLSEAIATFTVLIPELSKDLNAKLTDLDQYQSRSLQKAFQKFLEWDRQWTAFINQEVEEEEK